MRVHNHHLTDHEAVWLVKDFITDHALRAVKFYLNTNKEWNYVSLIEHLRTSFKSRETFSSLLGDFYGWYQKCKETEDQFTNELQILGWKVISVYPDWKARVDKLLKTQFAHSPQDQYFAAMAIKLLKPASQGIIFTKFWTEGVVMFGTRSEKPSILLYPLISLKQGQVLLTIQLSQPTSSAERRKRQK